MNYDFSKIEAKWQAHWKEEKTYKVGIDNNREKFYVLDMFPYPSGAGLHVGHPLGYIASDVIARYKRHLGFNVLHPMGYDSFGLPAEQYAIQTGQHPAITTEDNILRYREQLERIGFNYDWSREVRTSDSKYYKWTQWIFKQLFNSWYNNESNKAEPIDTLVALFEKNGTYEVSAATDEKWYENLDLSGYPFGEHFAGDFTATDWGVLSEDQKTEILSHFRLAFISDTWVNWCAELGTVLANDEIKDGLSERGGHPVERRLMKQWSLRITAYSNRLLEGLDNLDWQHSIKEIQRNWIGKSKGASVQFEIENGKGQIEVFTTRPDTIFGVSFLVLAPEHELVQTITTTDQKKAVEDYIDAAKIKTERDRQSDVKNVTGVFTGAHAVHPLSGKKLPIWTADYVLAGYGTGAVMSVPAGDQRDLLFAREFKLEVPNIFKDIEIKNEAFSDKTAVLQNSDFLDGMEYDEAVNKAIETLEQNGYGKGKTNYRLRDAIFSRQRYWGEPFPVYYKNGVPHLLEDDELPLTLPNVDKYLPTESGEPPLARSKPEDWDVFKGDAMEYNTMPGWAGSSWYFIRYLDPKNKEEMASKESLDYWGAVDLYMGGAEHATGHLLYSRFWTKFLYDLGHIPFDEPFTKMINQGMILGRSSLVYRLELSTYNIPGLDSGNSLPSAKQFPEIFVTEEIFADWNKNQKLNTHRKEVDKKLNNLLHELMDKNHGMDLSNTLWEYSFTALHCDVNMVHNDELDVDQFRKWRRDYKDAVFILNDEGKYRCGHEVEKMSKRWYNVVTPDDLCNEYGADTLRLYEMFLGPVEQSKPWDTQGISGVHNFLRKFWRLFHNNENKFEVSDGEPSKAELKTLHKTIKKVTEELDRLSWNTVVSTMMIAVNELTAEKSNNRKILKDLLVLISPYAPHFAEELWEALGETESITTQPWPQFNEAFMVDSDFDYPVSFNGKMRFKMSLSVDLNPQEVEAAIMASDDAQKYLEGKTPKKVIVVPKRIVNIVV